MTFSVRVDNLGKQYAIYHANRPNTLKEALVRRFMEIRPRERFWALKDVTFDVGRSEIVGVIGANGAGKSTLLRLIGGVGEPDTGSVEVRGRISALLELGAGFHGELTGKENIFVSGVIAGLTRAEVRERFDRIVEFAELASFIDNPLRTYSSGMQLRLAFSINIHTSPQILLVDEVLAVGDMAFQNKCLEMVGKLREDGCAIVLVSHDIHQVRALCNRVLWLKNGRMVMQGEPDDIAKHYEESMLAETRNRAPAGWPQEVTPSGELLRFNENRFGSMEVVIEKVRFLNSGSSQISSLKTGHALTVELCFNALKPVEAPVFVVTLATEDGTAVAEFSTASSKLVVAKVEGHGKIILEIERLDIAGGEYYVEVGAYPSDWNHTYDYHWHVHRLTIVDEYPCKGRLNPPHRWRIE